MLATTEMKETPLPARTIHGVGAEGARFGVEGSEGLVRRRLEAWGYWAAAAASFALVLLYLMGLVALACASYVLLYGPAWFTVRHAELFAWARTAISRGPL
jgi:hypothetical protein